ncbi:centrosomal protein 43-like [Euwallacea fornicatus]|uniref:centrosomal protein 43-like n=1 Tax=Euwallacea fornicatus TaxID=995702 RepID=UPI00338FA1BD
MSVLEEEVELRDLLFQTLETDGSLAKIRAQMRASIFLALDEDIKAVKQQPLQSVRVRSYLKTPEGRTLFYLVHEFLEFFNFQFTIQVFKPEGYLDTLTELQGRENLAKNLGLNGNLEVPLLQQILSIAQMKTKLDVTFDLNGSHEDESDSNKSQLNGKSSNDISCDDVPLKQGSCPAENGTVEEIEEQGFKNLSALVVEKTDGFKSLNATFNVNSPMLKNLNGDDKSSIIEESEEIEADSENNGSIALLNSATNDYEADFVSNNTSNGSTVSSFPNNNDNLEEEPYSLGTLNSSKSNSNIQVNANCSNT